MPISRMDLAEAGSPEALVKRILQAQPNLPVPVPIEPLCERFGILRIKDLDTKGFEGKLINDAKRAEGIVLAKRGGGPRRRFTIAQELGHFLMAHHVPEQPGRFLCRSSELRRVNAKEGDRWQRMEVEANLFASLMLMPPHRLRGAMAAFPAPDLRHVTTLARDFEVGKETAARAYVQYYPKKIAVVVAGNGRVQRCFRSLSFPAITCAAESMIPARTLYHRRPYPWNIASDIAGCAPDSWIDVTRDLRAGPL